MGLRLLGAFAPLRSLRSLRSAMPPNSNLESTLNNPFFCLDNPDHLRIAKPNVFRPVHFSRWGKSVGTEI
jgi:hypothetical protein